MTDPHGGREPDFLQNLRGELSGLRHWIDRAVVLGYAVLAGLLTVGFTIASNAAFALFEALRARAWWAPLVWTPAVTVAIVWAMRRWFPGAGGSGIPQVMAAQDERLPAAAVSRFVSLRLTLAKIVLGVAGFAAGLSIGREGPSVQVAAGVMHHARRWLRAGSGIDQHALLVAGGAAGIAAAFNAPLAGVVFAVEELSRRLESRSSGLIIAAIVLAGLVAVSAFGNLSYFGVIRAPRLSVAAILPGLAVTLCCGVLGGLFARLLIASLTAVPERLNRLRARYPLRFAATCGLGIALVGLAAGGTTFGAGSETVKHLLSDQAGLPVLYVPLKFIATWLTAWTGVPGGIFAPSLSIGAGVGHGIAQLFAAPGLMPALIAIGMACFLAAVTQAPLTAFIIVMEMVDGHAMVLSLMACAMLASLVARMISRPLYHALAAHLVRVALAPPAAAATPRTEAQAEAAGP